MITRIVRMTLHPEKVGEFKLFFNSSYSQIRNFEGCTHLELFEDLNQPEVLITLSKWDTEIHLENYRMSAVFRSTWMNVKPLFSAPALAFSMMETER